MSSSFARRRWIAEAVYITVAAVMAPNDAVRARFKALLERFVWRCNHADMVRVIGGKYYDK